MKKIDFIIKNFNSDYFIERLKRMKNHSNYSSGNVDEIGELIIESAIDIQSIRKSLSYYKIYKGNYIPQIFQKFYKKYKQNFIDKNINSFFIKKKIINNTWYLGNDESWYENAKPINSDDSDEFCYKDMVTQLIKSGAIFYKLKDFELIYNLGSKSEKNDDWYNAICFKEKKNKKFFLIDFFNHRSSFANDSYSIVKIFNQKPSISNILKILKNYINYKLYPSTDAALKYALFDKDLRKSYNENYNKKLYSINYRNEEEFFDLYKNGEQNQKMPANENIIKNFINENPEKYFPKINKKFKQDINFIADTIKEFWRINSSHSINKHKFYRYIMQPKFKWNTNKKFIESIMYSCDDFEGMLKYIPIKIQQSQNFVDEIRTLKMFRNKSKKFIVKVFKSNPEKLESLMEHYIPKSVLNDEYLMIEVLKLNKNLLLHVGEKLKNKSSFKKKIKKIVS